jgi:hypothetical protein
LNRSLRALALAPLILVLTIGAGCGEKRTDITAAVADFNSQFGGVFVLDCPDEVDGGEGTTFDCTLSSAEGEVSETVEFQVTDQDGDLVIDYTDEEQVDAAIERISGE